MLQNRQERMKAAVAAFQAGKPVIIMDDEDRENEGDICIPAQNITVEQVLLTERLSSGILCTSITALRAEQLRLPPMVPADQSTDPNGTPFTVPVDLSKKHGCSTGVSAEDKCRVIRALARPEEFGASDFVRPGHMYPLRANPRGLAARQGHTEASVDLCKLAGVYPAALIAEIRNPSGDGSMARMPECSDIAKKYNMPLITVQDIIATQKQQSVAASLPVRSLLGTHAGSYNGKLHIISGKGVNSKVTYAVLVKGEVKGAENVLTRVHSECLTGDILRSDKCDCGVQLNNFLDLLEIEETGILIYVLGHEGRGIGLENKIKCYDLQEKCQLDTVEANLKLHLPVDCRDYTDLDSIFTQELGVKSIHLLTSNPEKFESLKHLIASVAPFQGERTQANTNYLKCKTEKLKHRDLSVASPTKNGLKVGVVYTNAWHKGHVETLRDKCVAELKGCNCEVQLLAVPGSWELIMGAKRLIEEHKCDSIIILGILQKGDTYHFDNIAQSVGVGAMNLQLQTGVHVVYGVLTCYTAEHIEERVNGEKCGVKSWVEAAVHSGLLKNGKTHC